MAIAIGGGRQIEVGIWCDMLVMVGVVLSPIRWVLVKHTVANIEKLGQRLCDFLLILVIPST